MPKNLRRSTGHGDLHFITFCCYQRRCSLGTVRARNLAIHILQQVRARYGFELIGYVLMPEHVHLLISESGSGNPAKIVQVFKQRVSRTLREERCRQSCQQTFAAAESSSEFRRFWQRRYYDFNVYTRAKMIEKLQYMHGNPVRAKLVEHPADWPWSSWSDYYRGEGLLRMDDWN